MLNKNFLKYLNIKLRVFAVKRLQWLVNLLTNKHSEMRLPLHTYLRFLTISPQLFFLVEELEEWGLFRREEDPTTNSIYVVRKLVLNSYDNYSDWWGFLHTKSAVEVIEWLNSTGELSKNDYNNLRSDPKHPVYGEVNFKLQMLGLNPISLDGIKP